MWQAKIWNVHPNDLGHLLLFIIVNPVGRVFSRDFTTNSSPKCRALKIEKLKALLFGCEGAGIAYKRLVHYKKGGLELNRVQCVQGRIL